MKSSMRYFSQRGCNSMNYGLQFEDLGESGRAEFALISEGCYTPPRSPPDLSKHRTSSEVESDARLHQTGTSLSEIFESPHSQAYKGIRETVRTTVADPFTPLNRPITLPLFAGETSGSNGLHASNSRFLNQTQKSWQRLKATMSEAYQTMEDWLLREAPTNFSLSHFEQGNSFSSHNNDPIPTRTLRVTNYSDPPSSNPSQQSKKIRYRRPLSDPVLSVTKDVNRDLLRCRVLLIASSPDCLNFADNALAIAEDAGIYYLEAKSQLYRGLCLMELERWKEASFAFTRAASVRDWEGKVWELKNLAESKLLQESRRKGKRIMETINEEDENDRHR